ncbi:hypothetical protein pgond44_08030 [Psychroflexus gondwanensis ACAM 44]|uniref:Cell wall anchor protein n=1 Tax=Psychroflexus gondwanensis ACAM 44 TaxID=1189619 RepID=N1WLK1_9FLAO|nr:hypothetical protein [Psychroflexus gondwanensis]EMY81171.1 hypothetical protein pgond44_08030 [Psychroflexus gondwanensis ACAM 44]
MKKSQKLFLIALFVFQIHYAQVGIGTVDPQTSSILEVESTEQGVLLPRMSTSQRTSIVDPANGLTVFDTDLQSYYFYNLDDSSWESLSSSRLNRVNFVLVKSQADFPDPSGGKITLDENTYYEINGIVSLNTPIELNGAYISGLDASEDVLLKSSGNVFEGTGGSIRNITIAGGGNAFSITSGTSLLVQNTIISGMGNVGSVSDVGFVFFSNVQYLSNSNGIVYTNITNLLLNNQAWQASNSGTFEKFVGNFDLIQKGSGYSIANSSSTAIDVSANPVVGVGVISGTVFSGSSESMINRYTTAQTNLNFAKEWFVQAPGIQDEYDDIATGNVYYDGTLNQGYGITSPTSITIPFKLTGGSAENNFAINLLRFSSITANNRLVYNGKEAGAFSVNASLSVRGTNSQGAFYSFFIRRNGTETLNRTNAIFYVENITSVSSVSLSGTVVLEPDDFIEIWGQKLSGTGSGTLVIFSQNLNVN